MESFQSNEALKGKIMELVRILVVKTQSSLMTEFFLTKIITCHNFDDKQAMLSYIKENSVLFSIFVKNKCSFKILEILKFYSDYFTNFEIMFDAGEVLKGILEAGSTFKFLLIKGNKLFTV